MERANPDAPGPRVSELSMAEHLRSRERVLAYQKEERPARRLKWALITGEYPWQPGGVSDYTRLVARGLAEAGDEVHVWAPAEGEATAQDRGVEVHRLPGHFGPGALAILDRALSGARYDRIFVQYAPHAFGWKAMNLPFCLWLLSRRREAIWAMFHEVAYPCGWRQSARHNLLGLITRAMAALVAQASHRIFVSSQAWEPLLRRLSLGRPRPAVWLPVPSNLPATAGDAAVAAARAGASERSTKIIGHFGTFGAHIVGLLEAVLVPLLMADVNRVGMLLGRGSERFASKLVRTRPQLNGRLITNDDCSGERLASQLAICDILVQPYSDGASGRRGSLMAGLALGCAIVTNGGPSTETLWRESQAVMLAPAASSPALVSAAEMLLADAAGRAKLGARAAGLYKSRFALEHTLRELRL